MPFFFCPDSGFSSDYTFGIGTLNTNPAVLSSGSEKSEMEGRTDRGHHRSARFADFCSPSPDT